MRRKPAWVLALTAAANQAKVDSHELPECNVRVHKKDGETLSIPKAVAAGRPYSWRTDQRECPHLADTACHTKFFPPNMEFRIYVILTGRKSVRNCLKQGKKAYFVDAGETF